MSSYHSRFWCNLLDGFRKQKKTLNVPMIKLIPVLSILLSAIVFAGCDTIFPGTDNDGVRIRIHNTSSYAMKSISVSFPSRDVSYGDVQAGQKTKYIEVSKAYRYAYVETEIEGKTVVLQPIDYVGESLLDEDNYTYALSVYESVFDSEDYRYSLGLELIDE